MRKETLWARRVREPGDAPPIFRPFLDELAAFGPSEFPYTVFVPADRLGKRKTYPKLLSLRQERFIILEATRDGLIVTEYPYEAVDTVEIGCILLYAWFKVSGVNGGEAFTILFEYNAVADRFIRPAVESIRTAAAEIGRETMSVATLGADIFNDLINRDYKYMNFAKMSLIPGEKVLDYIYQPEVRVKRTWFSRVLFPAGILILTDHELILVQDAANPERRDPRYGGVWRHFPLRRIVGLSLENAFERTVNLTIETDHGKTCSVEFDAALRYELENLLDLYRTRSVPKSSTIA